MNKSLIVKLLAIPVFSASSMAFAVERVEPVSAEIVLSASQMDGVSAGTMRSFYFNRQTQQNYTEQVQAGNVNIAPAVGVQVLTVGSRNTTTSGGISQSNFTFQGMR